MSTYHFFSDPGHGWLEVTREELDRLNLLKQISGYSYAKGSKVYLEEDCDAGVFLYAKRNAGEPVEFMEVFQEVTPIRNYARFGG